MPWPLSQLWRLAVTASALSLVLQAVPATQAVPEPVLTVLGATLATTGIPGWAVIATLAGAGSALLVAVWHRAARPRPRARDLLTVVDGQRPYRRDLHAELVVDRRGYLFSRRVLFTASGLPWRQLRGLPRDYGERFVRPVAVHTEAGRTWWIVGNEFYRVNAAYSIETVDAIVEALRWRRRPRLDVGVPDGTPERVETFLSTCRPSLGRHNGLVCVRCRVIIDARDASAARLWTEVGLRTVDVQLLCGSCAGVAAPAARTS